MKKIILLVLLNLTFLFSQNKNIDITDTLKEKEVITDIVVNKLDYPYDNTCKRKYLERFIIANEKLIKNKEIEPEYLDLCRAYKKLFLLNKDAIKLKLSSASKIKKDKMYKKINKGYYKLLKKYKDSFYVNFYAKLFAESYNVSMNSVNYEIFKKSKSEYARYIRALYIGRDKEKKEEWKKYKDLSTKERNYRNLKNFVQSRYNIIYLNASKAVYEYLNEYENDKVRDFIEYRIKENKKRGLPLNRLYLNYSQYLLEKNIKNFKEAEKWVVKSYQEGKLYEQTIQLMKIRAVEIYFELNNNYPKYLGDREEVDYINDKLEKSLIQEDYIAKKSGYLYLNKSFLYNKKARVYKNIKKKRMKFKDKERRALERAIKYGKWSKEKKEELEDQYTDLKEEIKSIAKNKTERQREINED